MKENKLDIGSLPCKISWMTPLLVVCLVATVFTGILPFVCPAISGIILLCGTIVSSILWLFFFSLFAIGCKKLPYNVSTATMFMVLSGVAGAICAVIYKVSESQVFMGIGGVFQLLSLIGMFWLGNTLNKNYSGFMGKIGQSLLKVIKLYVIAIVVMGGCALSMVISPILALLVGLIGLFIGLAVIWSFLENVVISMYQLLEWGNQEAVSHNDIQSTVAVTK